MELKLVFTCTAILLLCSSMLAAAIECQNPLIFNFGDSNSDTGGYAASYGVFTGYPAGRKFFHRTADRFSDGRIILDFYCDSVKAEYMSSYLESLTPNFKTGVNFAVGGATVLHDSNFFYLKTQVHEFQRFHTRSVILHSEGIKGMFGEDDFRNAVYLIDIGQNDITGAFTNHSQLEVLEMIPNFIAGINLAIRTMYDVGGRKFWVHNTGPAGCLPLKLATHKVGDPQAEFDKAGCLKSLNELAQEFNSQLHKLCEDLRAQLPNTTVVYVDMYTIKYDLISNSPLYGFQNPLMACCGGGGPPYNANIMCGQPGFNVCAEDTNYISWDGVHYTDNANSVFAARVATTNYSTPPVKLEFFGVKALRSY